MERLPQLALPNLERLVLHPRSPLEPKRVDNDLAVSPSARMLFSVAQDENAFACGSNEEGQLGVGHTAGLPDKGPSPRKLGGSLRWVALSQGDNHGAGINDQGQLFSWGRCREDAKPEVCISANQTPLLLKRRFVSFNSPTPPPFSGPE
jgi:alpha-tubulin suppressor-like RCC1 family protein